MIKYIPFIMALNTNRAYLDYTVVQSGLTKMEARIWEQQQINMMRLQKDMTGQLFNMRNEIARKYWNQHGISVPKWQNEMFINIEYKVKK